GRAVTAGAVRTRNSVIRWLDAPLKSAAKARQVLPSLLDVQLPFPLEQTVSHFPALEKNETGGVRALAVAAREQTVQEEIERSEEAGFSPVRLDHEALALWAQSLEEVPPETGGYRVVVYLGAANSVTVLGRGSLFLNAHGSGMGFGDGFETGSDEARLDDFKKKLQRILSADVPTGGQPSIQWFWTGPGAEDIDLIKDLENTIQYAGSIFFQVVEHPSHFLARGLALRSLVKAGADCNFRVGRWQHPLARRRESTGRNVLAVTVAAGLLLLLGLNALWLSALRSRADRMQTALAERAQQLAPDARIQPGQEVRTVEMALDAASGASNPFVDAFQPSMNHLLAGVMEQAHAKGLVLEACTLRGRSVQVRGAARNRSDCD
ncbi:MAG: hypothetical protein AAF492_29865, partial [Verrucomicrobiota bacterium]